MGTRLKYISVIAIVFVFGLITYMNKLATDVGAEKITVWLEEHEEWTQERIQEMKGAETSWLNLAGLFWLEQGQQTFGTGAENDLVIRGDGPAMLGIFEREGDQVRFVTADAAEVLHEGMPIQSVEMKDDGGMEKPATVLSNGALSWWVIKRDGMLGVRVKDYNSSAWKGFESIPLYPYDAKWRIKARFEPFESPRAFTYPTILGTMREETSPGKLVFEYGGERQEMIPFERNEGTRYFLVFGDETNRSTTYNGGRFIYTSLPDAEGYTYIDFNRSYNPPCAFSDFSTCPQPLQENRLPFEVNAGELRYAKVSS